MDNTKQNEDNVNAITPEQEVPVTEVDASSVVSAASAQDEVSEVDTQNETITVQDTNERINTDETQDEKMTDDEELIDPKVDDYISSDAPDISNQSKKNLRIAVLILIIAVIVIAVGSILVVSGLGLTKKATNKDGYTNLNVKNTFEFATYSEEYLSKEDFEFTGDIELIVGDYDDYIFEGMLENKSDYNLDDIDIKIELYDDKNKLVDTVYIWEATIPANTTWKFSDTFYPDGEFTAYKLIEVAADYYDYRDDVIDEDLKFIEEPELVVEQGTSFIQGKIKNKIKEDISGLAIWFEIYDEDGYFIGTDIVTTEYLDAEGIFTFNLEVYYEDVDSIILSNATYYDYYVAGKYDIPKDDYEVVKDLSVVKTAKRDYALVGEIKNTSSKDIESAYIYVVFYNEEGELFSDTHVNLEEWDANKTLSFNESIYIDDPDSIKTMKLIFVRDKNQ